MGVVQGLRGCRVLVVEDDFLIADNLRYGLEERGVEVWGPVSGIADAVSLLSRQGLPDLAVLDVNLGDEMVYALADRLRDEGVPFLFATGYDRAAIKDGYQAVPHVEKPGDLGTLLRALEALVAHPG